MGSIRRIKTKRLTRGLDQVKADLASAQHLKRYHDTKASEDLPAIGEFYCIECAKWFEGQHNLAGHRRGKNHKRRVRELRAEAHTQKTAESAIGLSTDNGKKQDDAMVDG